MNRNVTAVILFTLAVGVYVTYTDKEWTKVQAIRTVNASYTQAISNADTLIKARDQVLKDYNALSATDKDRLEKMVPNTVDTIRLIIDLNNLAAKKGITLQGISATAASAGPGNGGIPNAGNPIPVNPAAGGAADVSNIPTPTLDMVKVTFSVNAPYETFVSFMRDLESDLRIVDIKHLAMTSSDTGVYNFSVSLVTYYLRQ